MRHHISNRGWNPAMVYFLALNSGRSGNDISIYPVTGIGFVLRDFSKVFSHTFRLESRVTPRRCANLCLRYRLRNLIQLALTLLFTFKTRRMTVSCFVFGVQYVCHLIGEAKSDVKLFGVLGRRVEERERHPG